MKGRSEMKIIIETDKKTIPALEALLEYKGGYICGFAQDAADVDKILRKLKGESGGKDCGAEYAPDPEKPAEGVEAGKKLRNGRRTTMCGRSSKSAQKTMKRGRSYLRGQK